jgi:calcium binding protein
MTPILPHHRPGRGQIHRPNGREEGSVPPRLSPVPELSEEELDALVEEATVDAYNDEEQLSGFAVMIEDNLEMPFETTVLGVMVTVNGITQTESGIIADCARDGQHQAISVLDLPLPEPPPKGAEWIAAYQHWAR